jgi:hypothetical protein
MKTIVVSAVNLNTGGTLTILCECLEHLSRLAETGRYRIIALVYSEQRAKYPHIEYIEFRANREVFTKELMIEKCLSLYRHILKKVSSDI